MFYIYGDITYIYIYIYNIYVMYVIYPPAKKETRVWSLVGKILNTPAYFLNDHQDTIV